MSNSTRNREGIAVERSADIFDEIQAASERVLAGCHLDRESIQLRQARAALRRIQEGTFGICERCDEEIHAKRLAAVPWTPFCLRCQEAADRNSEQTRRARSQLPERRLKARRRTAGPRSVWIWRAALEARDRTTARTTYRTGSAAAPRVWAVAGRAAQRLRKGRPGRWEHRRRRGSRRLLQRRCGFRSG